jgi:hypothetical protein
MVHRSEPRTNPTILVELFRRSRFVDGLPAESDLHPASTIADAGVGVSWAAVAAAAAALTLVLIAFGAGLGLSAVSPWSDTGVSSPTFRTGTGIYLVIVAVMSLPSADISPLD